MYWLRLAMLTLAVLGWVGAARAQVSYDWNNTAGGNWGVAGNWTPSGPPTGMDTATIGVAGTYTVTLDNNRSINNLTLNNTTATLTHSTGTLTVGGTVTLSAGLYSLGSATVSGGVFTSTGGVLRGTTLGSTLNDVTIGNGVLDFSAGATSVLLTGTSNFGSGATVNLTAGFTALGFHQSVTQNNLSVTLTASGSAVAVNGNSTLTWGASSTLTNNTAGINALSSDNFVAGTSTFLNQGLIRNTGSGQLTISADNFINQSGGVVRATAGTVLIASPGQVNQSGGLFDVTGGALTIGGANWVNSGTIALGSGTLNLGGSVATANIGVITRTGGTVNVTGAVNNTGTTLDLTTATGTYNLSNGSITGGSLTATGGSVLRLGLTGGPVGNSNRLINVSVGTGVLDFGAPAARVTVQGTTTLAAGTVLDLNGGSTTAQNVLAFLQTATVSNLTVNLSSPGASLAVDGTNTLTLAASTTVSGNSTLGTTVSGSGIATNAAGTGTVVNQGLIQNVNTGQLAVTADVFTNAGTLLATAGRLRVSDAVFAGGPAVTFTNYSNGTLTGGTYRVVAAAGSSAELDFQTRPVSTLAANTTVEVNGTNSTFTALNSLTTNNGTLRVFGGRTFAPTSGAVSNTGLIEIGTASTVSANLTTSGGGTVRGAGTLAGDLTFIGGGGTVGPGQVPGNVGPAALTVTGNVTLNANTIAAFKLNGSTAGTGYDQLVVNGAVDLGGATLNAVLGYTPVAGDKYFILNKTSAGAITGTFAGLSEGDVVTLDGYSAFISYSGDAGTLSVSGGNDVVLYNFVPVPEPATVLGIAVGSLLLGSGVRRVRRRVARLPSACVASGE